MKERLCLRSAAIMFVEYFECSLFSRLCLTRFNRQIDSTDHEMAARRYLQRDVLRLNKCSVTSGRPETNRFDLTAKQFAQ